MSLREWGRSLSIFHVEEEEDCFLVLSDSIGIKKQRRHPGGGEMAPKQAKAKTPSKRVGKGIGKKGSSQKGSGGSRSDGVLARGLARVKTLTEQLFKNRKDEQPKTLQELGITNVLKEVVEMESASVSTVIEKVFCGIVETILVGEGCQYSIPTR